MPLMKLTVIFLKKLTFGKSVHAIFSAANLAKLKKNTMLVCHNLAILKKTLFIVAEEYYT
ncbi:hypothetical protein [Bartonella apihabitans]|uniref:hypothetical protein n=2 Tax=Bartonella apihabitans TaxID=2750929 RepID=UPI003BB56C48